MTAPFDEAADPAAEALAIADELRKYDPALYAKPRWLVLNKTDLLTPEQAAERKAAFLQATGWQFPEPDDRFGFDTETPRLFETSAGGGGGTHALVQAIGQYLAEKKRQAQAEAADRQPETPASPQTDTTVLKAE